MWRAIEGRLALRLGVTAGMMVVVSACQDYAERRDTLSYQAGEAVAANKAIHIIDPWPAASANTSIEVSGRRVVAAIERLEARKPAADGASTSAPVQLSLVPTGPGAAPNAP